MEKEFWPSDDHVSSDDAYLIKFGSANESLKVVINSPSPGTDRISLQFLPYRDGQKITSADDSEKQKIYEIRNAVINSITDTLGDSVRIEVPKQRDEYTIDFITTDAPHTTATIDKLKFRIHSAIASLNIEHPTAKITFQTSHSNSLVTTPQVNPADTISMTRAELRGTIENALNNYFRSDEVTLRTPPALETIMKEIDGKNLGLQQPRGR